MKEKTYMPGYSESMFITRESAELLYSISKWTKFLAILGFVIIVFMVMGLLGFGGLISTVNHYEMSRGYVDYVSGMVSWGYVAVYVIMLLIYSLPVYYLYQFSSNTKKAIELNDTHLLTEATRFLKRHYKFIGILTIIWLVLILLSIIFMVFGLSHASVSAVEYRMP